MGRDSRLSYHLQMMLHAPCSDLCFVRQRHKGQRVWGPRLTPMWTVKRMPKGFSGAPVLTLGMFQVGNFNRSFQRVFRPLVWLELRLLSRPQAIVGGIVTYSVVGEIQLVWHLMVLSKEKPTSLFQVLSLSPRWRAVCNDKHSSPWVPCGLSMP